MDSTQDAEELLANEFGYYYLADELLSWTSPAFVARIGEMAKESADRIGRLKG